MKKFLLLLTFLAFSVGVFAQVTPPKDFFGFEPGADKKLFTYEKLIDYLKIAEQQSPRVKLVQIGTSAFGRPIYMVLVSAPQNLDNLQELKQINKTLALDVSLDQSQLDKLVDKGKVFLLMTLSMHSGEVGPSQALPEIVYYLATTQDSDMVKALDNVVYMAVANHNPDGMDMVVENYNKYLGTKYEGSYLPGLYHKYVGHDDNRDFVTLTQPETRAINNLFSQDWFPQILCEKHQMGMTGPRYFVPPKHNPIAQNIDAELWNWDGVFGLNMLKDMTGQGLAGVVFNYIFDDYWPGSTETAHWKNMIAMLTEAASARYASPVYIEDNELQVSGKGLAEYAKSVKMPLPWPGGWWRLSDIVRYEEASTYSMIRTAALYKDEILRLRNRLARKEYEKGLTKPPYYYVLPQEQHDKSEMVRLVRLLQEHGVKVYTVERAHWSSKYWINQGDVVIPLAQPFRAFIKEVMEKQTFPVRHYTKDGPMIRPYDITSWSLPLHRGVKAIELDIKVPGLDNFLKPVEGVYCIKDSILPAAYEYVVFPASYNDSYRAAFKALSLGVSVKRALDTFVANGVTIPAGSFLIARNPQMQQIVDVMDVDPVFLQSAPQVKTSDVTMPRIALVETYYHDMDAGWTRYVFDTYFIPYTVLRPADFQDKKLDDFDIIIFPDNSPEVLKSGKFSWRGEAYSKPFYPPEYTKGMGEKGFNKLLKYVNDGGIVIAWGRSTGLFKGTLKFGDDDEVKLPYDDISEQLQKKGLYIPGSLVRINLKPSVITYGMPLETGVFYRGRPVFVTSVPVFDTDRRVLAEFPADEDQILLSGYAENQGLIARRTSIVWLRKNKGQLLLFSFNPQFRGSTQGTFKLLFNSLLLPGNLTDPML